MPRRPARVHSATRSSDSFECFAAAAPGLEKLVADELSALGISPRAEEGGAAFHGTLATVARANLWLRVASRVIVRVARFRAQAFHELERLSRAVAWERFVAPGAPVRFRVTSRKSRLYHSGAIAQRFAEAIEHRLGKASRAASAARENDENASADTPMFVIRVIRDVFNVSVDSSGALLHQRGYRQALAKAPMRETLAAAMLLASRWDGRTPLLDPMCGSGSIPIEGALLARRIAPGLNRSFACERWPEASEARWASLREEAMSIMLQRAPTVIRGSDRDAGAIDAARANATRAGVALDIEFSRQPLSALVCPQGGIGSVVTNPPYGVRVGEVRALRDLYARFGQVLRSRCPHWHLVMLSANPQLDAQLRIRMTELARTSNGGIPVRILSGEALR